MIAIDTNLLVYAHRRGAAEHRAAQQVIERAAADSGGWGLALACVAEFWAVVTHPSTEGAPSTGLQASAFIRSLQDAGAQVWLPGPGFGGRLLQLAAELGTFGPRVFDLQIGLTAFEAGATELWTHDVRFVPVPGLRVVHPLV